MTTRATSPASRRAARAFSLVELIIVMTLLTVIVLGLLAVFNQTQRAFKAGMAQVDVMESGRATMDLIAREVEQMAPVGQDIGLSPAFGPDGVYFTSFKSSSKSEGGVLYKPLLQRLPGSSVDRQNVLQQVFFIRRVNQDLYATAYYVLDHDPTGRDPSGDNDGLGTLYRWTLKVPTRDLKVVPSLYDLFYQARTAQEWIGLQAKPNESVTKLAEGVVHFKVTPFGLDGWALEPGFDTGYDTNSTKVQLAWDNPPNGIMTEFYHGAIPTGLEIELAVVEEEVRKRLEGLPPNAQIRRDYLYEEGGKTHLFKQQIPIRNADERFYR